MNAVITEGGTPKAQERPWGCRSCTDVTHWPLAAASLSLTCPAGLSKADLDFQDQDIAVDIDFHLFIIFENTIQRSGDNVEQIR